MEPKKLFSVKWTQAYPTDISLERAIVREIEALLNTVIEQVLEDGDFTEANNVINRIKAL